MKKKHLIVILILSSLFFQSTQFGYASSITSEQAFYEYVRLQYGGSEFNIAGRIADWNTYKKYNLIVFGSPWGDYKDDSTDPVIAPGPQRRYLGYTYTDSNYTNPFFPPDQGGGGAPETFNYIKVQNALQSWEGLDDAQVQHLLNSPLSGNGATDLTVQKIGGKEYAKVLSPPTWKSGGSVYTLNIK